MKNFKLLLWVIFIQVFILNNIQFNGYINPYYYLIFILHLNPKTSKIGILLWSFILGGIIDIFSYSYGLHAFASVFIAYTKIIWTSQLKIRKDTDEAIQINQFPIAKFTIFAFYMVLIHHFILFFLESFSLYDIFYVLKTTMLSSIFTLILLIIHKIIIIKKI